MKIALSSCYIEEYIDFFMPFFGRFGAWPRITYPLGSAFEGPGSPPSVNMCIYVLCIPSINVDAIFQDGCIRLGDPSFSVPLVSHGLQKRPQLLLI